MSVIGPYIVLPGTVPGTPPGAVPLVVSAILASPIVTADEVVMLDGILGGAVLRRIDEELGREALPALTPRTVPLDLRLPLQAWHDPDVDTWGWCASAADWGEHITRSTHDLRRRPPVTETQRLTTVARIDVGLGPAKAKNVPMPQVHAPVVRWYCVGVEDGVRDLLGYVSCIGRLSGHGRGEVHEWRVEPSTEPDAWMRRPLPTPNGDQEVAVRPPYWHRLTPRARCSRWG